MVRKIRMVLLTGTLLCSCVLGFGQIQNPVKDAKGSIKKQADKPKNEVNRATKKAENFDPTREAEKKLEDMADGNKKKKGKKKGNQTVVVEKEENKRRPKPVTSDLGVEGNQPNYDQFEVSRLPSLSTPYSDVMNYATRKQIVISSQGKSGDFGKSKKKKEGDYDYYIGKKDGFKAVTDMSKVKGKANSSYNDVGAIHVPGSDSVLFSKSVKYKSEASGEKQSSFRIFLAKVVDESKWKKPVELPFNGDISWSNFQPALHPEKTGVIFASDRPGGYGGIDLYEVSWTDGEWGEPQNLGPEVNTPKDEVFPSYDDLGNLYFASNGHGGMGGFDLFAMHRLNGQFHNLENLGGDINSQGDDIAMHWAPGQPMGYFSSNREDPSNSDIYYFKRLPLLHGFVRDSLNYKPLDSVIISRISDNSQTDRKLTNTDGDFNYICEPNRKYLLMIQKKGYKSRRLRISTKKLEQAEDIDISLSLNRDRVYSLTGLVADAFSGRGIDGVVIKVDNDLSFPEENFVSEIDGSYEINLMSGATYSVIYQKRGFVPIVLNLTLEDINEYKNDTMDVTMRRGDFMLVKGSIFDREDVKEGLDGASVHLIDNNTQAAVDSFRVGRDGEFFMALPWGDTLMDYSIIAAREGYMSSSINLMRKDSDNVDVQFTMIEPEYGPDKVVVTVFHGYNQSDLPLISKKQLNEIVFFLKENPYAKAEVVSHTDSRGNRLYNLALSKERAEAVVDYICARRGISKDRFIIRGLGEEYPLNGCVDGVECTEEQHSQNRRTEIKLLDQ